MDSDPQIDWKEPEKPTWQADEDVTSCSSCGKVFGKRNLVRRHHCRACGRLFCSKCSSRTMKLPESWGYAKEERVCDNCFANRDIFIPPASIRMSTPVSTSLGTEKSVGRGDFESALVHRELSDLHGLGFHNQKVLLVVGGVVDSLIFQFLDSIFGGLQEVNKKSEQEEEGKNLPRAFQSQSSPELYFLIMPTEWLSTQQSSSECESSSSSSSSHSPTAESFAKTLFDSCEPYGGPSAIISLFPWTQTPKDPKFLSFCAIAKSFLSLSSKPSSQQSEESSAGSSSVEFVVVLKGKESEIPDNEKLIPQAQLEKWKKKGKTGKIKALQFQSWAERCMKEVHANVLSDSQNPLYLCYDCFDEDKPSVDLNGVRRLRIPPSGKRALVDEPWLLNLIGVLFSVAHNGIDTIFKGLTPQTVPESHMARRQASSGHSPLSHQTAKALQQDTKDYVEGNIEKNREKWYINKFGMSPSSFSKVTRQFLFHHGQLASEHECHSSGKAKPEPFFTEEERSKYVYVFVPGLYSGFFPGGEDAPDQFKSWLQGVKEIYGIDTRYMLELQVDASCSHNARTIFEFISNIYKTEGKQVVLLGYSKGSADVATTICLYREKLVPIVRAFVSMMGAFGGSAIASALYGNRTRVTRSLMERIVKKQSCKIDALKDITLDRRDALLTENPFPVGIIPILSIVGSIRDCSFDDMYPLYKFIHFSHNTESDGLICTQDQTLPGSCVVQIRGMNHTGAGDANIVFRDPVAFIGCMFGTAIRADPERPDCRLKMYVRIRHLIASNTSIAGEDWKKIQKDLEELKISPSSEGSSQVGGENPSSGERLVYTLDNLFQAKLQIALRLENAQYTSDVSRISTKKKLESKNQIGEAAWNGRTCFSLWSEQIQSKKLLLLQLQKHHSLRSPEQLVSLPISLSSLQLEPMVEATRELALTSNLMLIVNFLCVPEGTLPPEDSVFGKGAPLSLPVFVRGPNSKLSKKEGQKGQIQEFYEEFKES